MKRLLSMLLALVLALGLLPAGAFAASSEEEALGEVNIFNGGYRMNYLAMNVIRLSQQFICLLDLPHIQFFPHVSAAYHPILIPLFFDHHQMIAISGSQLFQKSRIP